MNENLKRFSVEPSVILADKESKIQIRALDGRMIFYDDITYAIQIVPTEELDVQRDDALTLFGIDEKRETYYVNPVNGVITIKHFFSSEQMWTIHISTKEYEKYYDKLVYKERSLRKDALKNIYETGVKLYVYSVYKDLYTRHCLKGDLHVHTNHTDADDSPTLVACEYRKAGYDFVAISDHGLYDIGKYARDKFDFKTDFQILTAEEIHNGCGGQLHIINIEGKECISDIYVKEPEKIKNEIEKLKKITAIPDGIDENEYLNRLWVYNRAKKTGGLVIFPHPHWFLKKMRWHVNQKMSTAILKNGLCDAFEIIGGNSITENNLQVNLFNEIQSEGLKMPVVGSTDCHSVLSKSFPFHSASTYVFAEEKDVKNAVLEGYCVAAEHSYDEPIRLYGSYRLVRYARFLADNFFPIHEGLCAASGEIIRYYVNGEKNLKDTIEILEQKIINHKKKFFGRG